MDVWTDSASILPDPSLFIYLYVRKEAVLSSQIEGTQSSFSDLMLFESAEAPSVPLEDVQEVSNYVAAMNHGLRRLREDFPLSLRLIREIHKILLSKGRGSQKRVPGRIPARPKTGLGAHGPRKRSVCSTAAREIDGMHGRTRKVHLHREQWRDLPILVKTVPWCTFNSWRPFHPILGWEWKTGPIADYLLAVRSWSYP